MEAFFVSVPQMALKELPLVALAQLALEVELAQQWGVVLRQEPGLPLPLQQLVAQKLLEFECLELPKVEGVASRMGPGKSSHQEQKR